MPMRDATNDPRHAPREQWPTSSHPDQERRARELRSAEQVRIVEERQKWDAELVKARAEAARDRERQRLDAELDRRATAWVASGGTRDDAERRRAAWRAELLDEASKRDPRQREIDDMQQRLAQHPRYARL